MLGASLFEIKDTKMINVDPIQVINQLDSEFIVDNVDFEWHLKTMGKPPESMI